jgi:hypothetical protein
MSGLCTPPRRSAACPLAVVSVNPGQFPTVRPSMFLAGSSSNGTGVALGWRALELKRTPSPLSLGVGDAGWACGRTALKAMLV